jgi:RNA polymerase sigma-70 factor (ECF subfamily)
MSEIPAAGSRGGGARSQRGAMTTDAVSAWFICEILPLEAILMGYLRHNWRNKSDIADLRQEVYARVFDAARAQIPDNAKRFLLVTARNLLIDLIRREQVVPIEAVADLEALGVAIDTAGPDRVAIAREELRRLQAALAHLSPRARQAVSLAYIEGLTGSQIAERMGVTKSTVSQHLGNGIRTLINILSGATPDGESRS